MKENTDKRAMDTNNRHNREILWKPFFENVKGSPSYRATNIFQDFHVKKDFGVYSI